MQNWGFAMSRWCGNPKRKKFALMICHSFLLFILFSPLFIYANYISTITDQIIHIVSVNHPLVVKKINPFEWKVNAPLIIQKNLKEYKIRNNLNIHLLKEYVFKTIHELKLDDYVMNDQSSSLHKRAGNEQSGVVQGEEEDTNVDIELFKQIHSIEEKSRHISQARHRLALEIDDLKQVKRKKSNIFNSFLFSPDFNHLRSIFQAKERIEEEEEDLEFIIQDKEKECLDMQKKLKELESIKSRLKAKLKDSFHFVELEVSERMLFCKRSSSHCASRMQQQHISPELKDKRALVIGSILFLLVYMFMAVKKKLQN